jgi:PKD repeat protein
MKKPLFIVAILMFSALALQAQESATTMAREGSTLPLSFNLSPGVFVPLGETSTYFILGASSIFGVSYRLPLRLVALVAEVGYGWDPMREATQSLSLGSIAAGAGLRFDLGPRFLLKLQGQGGYYQGILHSTGDFISDGGAYLSVGAGATFFVTPVLGLGLGARYVNYIPVSQGLIGALELTWDRAGAADRAKAIRVRAPARRPELLRGEVIKGEGEGLKLNEIHWENIFPVLYKYYDAHRIGYAVLKNNEEEPVTDVKLTLMIKGYMDSPMSCPTPPELKGGGQITVDLPALFNKSVLEITETEGTKVAVDLSLQYKYRGEWIQETQNQQLRILNRNNMVWDDDRKVAAFVTSTDPAVQLFSKNVLNITKGRGSRAVNENLMSAMALHEALHLYGVNYVIDPRSSYAELSQTKD